ADDVRRLGLPLDHPTDVAYFTRFNGMELARLRMPSSAEVIAQVANAARTDQVPEPIHRANQVFVERLLLERAKQALNITLRFGWRVERFEQDEAGVRVSASNAATGTPEAWSAQYLVGCDGGRSEVRRALGISFRGSAEVEQGYFSGRMFTIHVRAPD